MASPKAGALVSVRITGVPPIDASPGPGAARRPGPAPGNRRHQIDDPRRLGRERSSSSSSCGGSAVRDVSARSRTTVMSNAAPARGARAVLRRAPRSVHGGSVDGGDDITGPQARGRARHALVDVLHEDAGAGAEVIGELSAADSARMHQSDASGRRAEKLAQNVGQLAEHGEIL